MVRRGSSTVPLASHATTILEPPKNATFVPSLASDVDAVSDSGRATKQNQHPPARAHSTTPKRVRPRRPSPSEGNEWTQNVAEQPMRTFAENLRYLYYNTLTSGGKPWTIREVAARATKLGLKMTPTNVDALLKGRTRNVSLQKAQVLGMVFGVGSLGLIHALEPQNGQDRDTAMSRVLREAEQNADALKLALTRAGLKEAVLLLDSYQHPETLQQAIKLIGEIGELDKRMSELSSSQKHPASGTQ